MEVNYGGNESGISDVARFRCSERSIVSKMNRTGDRRLYDCRGRSLVTYTCWVGRVRSQVTPGPVSPGHESPSCYFS